MACLDCRMGSPNLLPLDNDSSDEADKRIHLGAFVVHIAIYNY